MKAAIGSIRTRDVIESRDILQERLTSQCLSVQTCLEAADVVSWFGAIQAQEFQAAAWALALRAAKATKGAEIERIFNQGSILRAHVLRSTWHFVASADIHWLRELTAARVHQGLSTHDKKFGITGSIRNRTNAAFERAFRRGGFLTRAELGSELRRSGIDAKGTSLAILTVHAEADGVLCSGPQHQGELTYALLSERVPKARHLKPDEALAELTLRYFQSHGPATERDFVWWSGLTMSNARRGLEMNRARSKMIGGLKYWFVGDSVLTRGHTLQLHLLPVFDEFLIAYRDRQDRSKMGRRAGRVNDQNALIVNGQMVGYWKCARKSDDFAFEVAPWRPLDSAERVQLAIAAAKYYRFLGVALPDRPTLKITVTA